MCSLLGDILEPTRERLGVRREKDRVVRTLGWKEETYLNPEPTMRDSVSFFSNVTLLKDIKKYSLKS